MTQQVNLSEAARMTGVSRSTIQRDKQSGRLSVTTNAKGKPFVSISELIRVYGAIEKSDDSRISKAVSDEHLNGIEKENKLLKKLVDQMEEQLRQSGEREKELLEMLKNAPKIEHKPHKKGLLGRIVDTILD